MARPLFEAIVRRLASTHGMSWSTWKSRQACAPPDWLTQFVYHPTLPPSGMTVMSPLPAVCASTMPPPVVHWALLPPAPPCSR